MGIHIFDTIPCFSNNFTNNFINFQYLAMMSKYFCNLFFKDWKERRKNADANNSDGKDEFEINETEVAEETEAEDQFDITAFKWMVYSALTMGWMVRESNFLTCEKMGGTTDN